MRPIIGKIRPAALLLVLPCALAILWGSTLGVSFARADAILDLRRKIVDFSTSQARKRWQIEDRMIQREQRFQDGLRQEYREVALQALQQIKQAPDWRSAKRAYKESIRQETALLRQKVRLHRDEFDLKLLSTSDELQKELTGFLAPLEQLFRQKKDEAYRKAEEDFDTSRGELREELRDWKDRMKGLKTPSDFSAN